MAPAEQIVRICHLPAPTAPMALRVFADLGIRSARTLSRSVASKVR